MKHLTIILAFLVMLNSQAFAQEFKSLKSIVADDPATTYPLVRCGAMYQAIMERIGYERLGEEKWALNDEVRTSLLLFSSLLLKEELPTTSIEEISEITANDARRIADIYIQRMNNNYAMTGEAYGSDELIISDLTSCKQLAEEVVPLVRSLDE